MPCQFVNDRSDRHDRREPDEDQAQEGRDPDHQREGRLVAARQQRVLRPAAAASAIRPAGRGDRAGRMRQSS